MTIKQIDFVAGEAFSRKQMDQMGLPIGNPHKPPFKQKEMPFFIAPAIGAVGAATGFVATTLAVVNAVGVIASVAGTAMSVVGMVTGDKSLMKLGAIVGLAGGVASLASGAVASLSAGGEFAFGTAGIQSANAANAANATATAGINSMLGTTQIAQGQMSAAANASPLIQGGAGGNTLTSQLNNLVAPSATGQLGQVAATGGQLGQAVGTGANGLLSSSQALAIDGAKAMSTTSSLANSGSSGYFSKLISDMTPKDYLLMGGSVVSGGMQAVKENQANAAQQQQYEYKQAQRNTQLKNMNTPLTLSPKNTLQVGNYSKNPDLKVNI
jgi:hypothetical protein